MMIKLRCSVILTVGSLASACALDTLGHESNVSRSASQEQQAQLEDDRIEDKHPIADPTLAVTDRFPNGSVTLNKSGSVIKLSVAAYDGERASLAGGLYPDRGAALAAIAATPGSDVIPSMETVNGRLKPFNDGLYAALELAMEEGVTGGFRGKRQLLRDILAALQTARAGASATAQAALDGSMSFVGAALVLAGTSPALTGTTLAAAQARATEFQTDTLFSKPVGFYSWTPALQAIFQQDRFLQRKGSFADLAGVALVLQGDAGMRDAYQTTVALYAGLTNPYVSYTLTALLPDVTSVVALDDVNALQHRFDAAHPAFEWACSYPTIAFLPASRSKDTTYFNSLCDCDWSRLGSTNLMDTLIAAIRSGALDLATDAGSGWYDYQLYALETLLVPERGPESDHLLLTAAYKKKLIDTFKTLITQTRETHVKSLSMGGMAASAPPQPVEVYPLLAVEPFPTFYLRTGRAYRFLGAFLQATLGSSFLGGLARLHEDGSASQSPLPVELKQTTELLYGLHATACASLGMRSESYLLAEESAAIDQTAAATQADEWLRSWRTDPDVLADPRVIVPIGFTESGIRYWATIGVKPLQISAEYVAGYEPEIVSGLVSRIVPHNYDLLVEDTVEIVGSTTAPPTRAEFRQICDENVTRDAIIAALKAR